ncbi:type 1 fimbrial protein (plasmid) [Escherichia coli]|uniref:fimbrial protein n=1 Tax=Escherichia coli TaxID=562 RepID=UPI0015E9AC93|nr:fimbrial protein [Escherichia coli]MCX2011689.1 type 1 fimbrial protein [Escherichia coli]MED8841369.1 fimbrial protein [Escherichia coli]QMA72591.1 type 1 fimbrial protein [Escherichia coli]QMC99361.1 type 1 fimbrial protein [Escherichia coli]QME92965.1 type 1 fimbrial protein [Escherichia coli]
MNTCFFKHNIIRHCWKFLFFILCSFIGASASGEEESALHFNGIVTNGTCGISVSPSAIDFLPVYSGEFSSTGHTSQIRPISIILSGCNLIDGDGEHLAIKVNGEMAKFDSSLFLNSQETTASGVGIMLLPGKYTGDSSGFYQPERAIRDGSYCYKMNPKSLITKNFIFSIGLTNGNNSAQVKAGVVKSTVTFTFQYH